MFHRPKLVGSAMTRFGLAGLLAVLVLGALTLVAVSRVSESEALDAAKERARLAGYGIVEPALNPILLDPSQSEARSSAQAELDNIVQSRVLSERVMRVKVWSPGGQVVYSDEPALIGAQFAPKPDHQEVLRTGAIEAEIADTDSPENRLELDSGRLLEVYLPMRLDDGRQVVYEQYELYDSVTSNSRRLLRRLALPLALGLGLLWLTQLPLAWSLARRVRVAETERAGLLERAVTASERERERIAADLHDGVVQDLAGLTFELAATTSNTPHGELRDDLERSTRIARAAMQRLRSSLVDIHPPTVATLGLRAAMAELVSPLERSGVAVTVALNAPDLSAETETLLFRSAQELVRNVEEHAQATAMSVTLTATPETVVLTVEDNGAGFTADQRADRQRAGHIGLDLQQAVLKRAGALLTIKSNPGLGTTARVEIPR
jgi:two-component system, NarL family, sensor kinase